ncbi:MAG: 50S ribosomal protein L21 [Proteobacteria bacterium]|nr:50S ribosomal protein L21 [Pseudomonadota bacterium]
MFAIIESGSRQYRVAENNVIKVNKIDADIGSIVDIGRVLAVHGINDKGIVFGEKSPTLKVTAEVLEQKKDKKVIIFKKRRRHNSRKKNGYRHDITVLRIKTITM